MGDKFCDVQGKSQIHICQLCQMSGASSGNLEQYKFIGMAKKSQRSSKNGEQGKRN